MFFHIDESGNTGNNLFDENQPILSYGVLSCRTNVDAIGGNIHKQILKVIDSDQIHANALGYAGLVEIAPLLIDLQRKMRFDFDYYFVHKQTLAVITFFEAVFDQGLNRAVPWNWYWTPLRFLLIAELANILEEEILHESWRLCNLKKIENSEGDVISLLQKVKHQVISAGIDRRAEEVIVDGLDFGILNPLSLDFGSPDRTLLSPNVVGFQFVAGAMVSRVRKKRRKRANSIVIDRQSQFNRAQLKTHSLQALMGEVVRTAPKNERDFYLQHPLHWGIDHEQLLHRGLKDNQLSISRSIDSIGLQVVDVYLWIANKLVAGEELPIEFRVLCSKFLERSISDGIWLGGILDRFRRFESELPPFEELTDEQKQQNRESIQRHREWVRNHKRDQSAQ